MASKIWPAAFRGPYFIGGGEGGCGIPPIKDQRRAVCVAGQARCGVADLSRGFAGVAAATKCEGFQPDSAAAAIGAAGAVE